MTRSLALLFLLAYSTLPLLAQEAPLTLDRAIELALSRNERAAAAETSVDAAEARLRQARSFLLPQVNISSSFRNDSAADTRQTLGATALLSQTLFDARAFPLFRQARLERDASRLSATDERRLLAYDAADAFVVALNNEQVLLAAEHRREFARGSLSDSRARFEAGLVSSNDVTRAELELATAERGVAQARGAVEAARLELGNILNTEVDEPLVVPEGVLAAAGRPPAVGQEQIAAAQRERSDIAASRLRVEALREFASEPGRRIIPNLTLNAQTRNINEGPISQRNNDGFVGVTLNWPVFDAGIRGAQTAERAALVRNAELQLGLAQREVERQLRTAAVQLASEQASLTQAGAALTAARRNADETNELYRQGLATALELADATQQLFEAEVAEVTARYRMAQAYLAVREARGISPMGE